MITRRHPNRHRFGQAINLIGNRHPGGFTAGLTGTHHPTTTNGVHGGSPLTGRSQLIGSLAETDDQAIHTTLNSPSISQHRSQLRLRQPRDIHTGHQRWYPVKLPRIRHTRHNHKPPTTETG